MSDHSAMNRLSAALHAVFFLSFPSSVNHAPGISCTLVTLLARATLAAMLSLPYSLFIYFSLVMHDIIFPFH